MPEDASASRHTSNPTYLPGKQAILKEGLAPANREESDNYKDVVAILTPKLRVIRCRDGIQWIVQRQNNKRGGLPIWTSFAYCATRQGLLIRIRDHLQAMEKDEPRTLPLDALVGRHCDPEAWAVIQALPKQAPHRMAGD
jgi:hypothetical protein